MTFIDLFAGIGGFRIGLERNGFKCMGYSEIDKFAIQTYRANFDTKDEVFWNDITRVTTDELMGLRGKIDIIAGGFPCQSFSMAGKRGGFDDTRGTLIFNVLEAARIIRPRYLVLENVKGLLSHAGGTTAKIIFNALGELGYFTEWQICNSKNFGVPQDRPRIYIVGHLGGEPRRKVFPVGGANSKVIESVVRGSQGYSVYKSTGVGQTVLSDGGGLGRHAGLIAVPVTSPAREEVRPRERRFRDVEGTSPTLTAIDRHGVMTVPVLTPMRENKRQMGRRFKTDGEPAFTVTAQDRHGVLQLRGPDDVSKTVRCGGRGSPLESKQNHDSVYDGARIRRFTPLECFRLQGFPDSHYHNARAVGISDNQLYRQAGNAVTVNVVETIGARLREISGDS